MDISDIVSGSKKRAIPERFFELETVDLGQTLVSSSHSDRQTGRICNEADMNQVCLLN